MKGCGYFEDIDKKFMFQKNLTSFNSVQYFLRNDQKCTKKRDFFCPKRNAQKLGFNWPEILLAKW